MKSKYLNYWILLLRDCNLTICIEDLIIFIEDLVIFIENLVIFIDELVIFIEETDWSLHFADCIQELILSSKSW